MINNENVENNVIMRMAKIIMKIISPSRNNNEK